LLHDYAGQVNPMHIVEEDETKVLPYVQWAVPQSASEPVLPTRNHAAVLAALQARSRTKGNALPSRKTTTTTVFDRDIWLAQGLKAYYGYRCQLCG
jgi:hypothetical protein